MDRSPPTDPVGVIRIHYPRHWMSCWVFGDRAAYDRSVNEAIRLHPAETIHASWMYRTLNRSREDRTRYTPEGGRINQANVTPVLLVPDGPLTRKETA